MTGTCFCCPTGVELPASGNAREAACPGDFATDVMSTVAAHGCRVAKAGVQRGKTGPWARWKSWCPWCHVHHSCWVPSVRGAPGATGDVCSLRVYVGAGSHWCTGRLWKQAKLVGCQVVRQPPWGPSAQGHMGQTGHRWLRSQVPLCHGSVMVPHAG